MLSGNLRVKGLKGHSLNLGTVSGDLTLSNVACDRLGARSVSGNVEYSGMLTKNGRYDLNSHSGTVRLALDGATGFELNGSSFSGSIRSELPLTMGGDRESSQRDDARGPGRRRGRVLNNQSMRAAFGDGSATLTIRTFSGDIVIAKGKIVRGARRPEPVVELFSFCTPVPAHVGSSSVGSGTDVQHRLLLPLSSMASIVSAYRPNECALVGWHRPC